MTLDELLTDIAEDEKEKNEIADGLAMEQPRPLPRRQCTYVLCPECKGNLMECNCYQFAV